MRLFFSTFLLTFTAFSQDISDTTLCIYEFNGSIDKIEEEIEFIISYNNIIDMTNENCISILNETNSYFSENMKTNTLCLIYMIGQRDSKTVKFIDLFNNNSTMDSYTEKIQMIHVIDKRTDYANTFTERTEILDLLKKDIRKGLNE